LNPFPKDEAERIIANLVAVLDRYTKLYSQLSHGRYADYASYMASDGIADEDEFIKPKLFTDFLREVLLFPSDEYVSEHETATGVPDFQPTVTLLHPFFFEIKGSDTLDLTQHRAQVTRYLKPPFEHGVLTNMRHILVYEKNGLEVSRIGLLDLYRAYRDQPKAVLDFPNTRAFLEFVSQFRRKELTRERKVELLLSDTDVSLMPAPAPEKLVAAIHRIVTILGDDARRFKDDLERILKSQFNVDDRESVLHELDQIAWELDHRYIPVKENRVSRYLNARTGSLEARAFDIFVTRVAYFTMTRFLVARMWEDAKFLEPRLYDGGFRRWYETLGRRIQEVLKQAFHYAGDRYAWLYGQNHNYFWYDPPSEEAIIDVLFELAPFNLGLLDTDVLGTVYERFVDRVDRKNKGQYYTPREVIKFIWDRVGYTSDDAFFRFEEGRRAPKLVLDIATGSGGFLVEAAHRMRTMSRCSETDPNEMLDLLYTMVNGLWGCEISQFANYITEVNMLIQLTPLVRAIIDSTGGVPRDLRAIKLMTAPGDSLALVGAGPLFNPNNDHMVRDATRELVRHDPKGPVRELLTSHFDFDYVCSNPPYVGEKGHKELFRSTRAALPYWNRHYQGKMDYLYWFVILGLLKLRRGGKLGFITTSYWPTADGASHLREFILENALILEIIDFGETRIFESAPGQHNMVFVLEKCPSSKPTNGHPDGMEDTEVTARKQQHRIKIVKVKAVPPPKPGDTRSGIARVIEHVSSVTARTKHSDNYVDVYQSAMTQGELSGDGWAGLLSPVTSKAVASLDKRGVALSEMADIVQGVVSGADSVTARNIELIPQRKREQNGVSVGDGIFVLRAAEAAQVQAQDGFRLVATYRNSDVSPYIVEPAESEYILYMSKDAKLSASPGVALHLGKYREILEDRLRRYEESYPWYCLHRERDAAVLGSQKIVTPRWGGDLKHFAYQTGDYFENSDMNAIVPKPGTKESVKYLLGLLNSRPVQAWLSEKARQKGLTRQSILFEIPVHRINFGDKREVARHDKLVKLVDEMIETKQALANTNRFFGARLTRLNGPDELPEAEVEAVTRSLAGSALRLLSNHPKIEVKPEPTADFVLSGIGEIGDAADLFNGRRDEDVYALRLNGKGRKTTDIIAPKEVLKYLQKVLPKFKGNTWPEIKEIPVARDLDTYQAKEKKVVSEAKSLLRKVASIQSKIDAIVYDLYGLTKSDIATIETRQS